MGNFQYYRPSDMAEAVALLSGGGNRTLIAGGQALLNMTKAHHVSATAFVDIKDLGLADIKIDDDAVYIGATATHVEISHNKVVQEYLPGLAKLASIIGDHAVRNFGTIGGAVALNDPSGDYPASLLALDAVVVTQNREIRACDFFRGAHKTDLNTGEIITGLKINTPQSSTFARIEHPATRSALVGVFVASCNQRLRVAAYGAYCEGAVLVKMPSDNSRAINVPTVKMIDDSFASSAYRANLVKVLISEALTALE